MKPHTHRTSRLVGSALAIVIAAAAPACLDASDEPSEAPIARFAASERSTSEMGVKIWEVRNDGTEDHLIGRDASSARVVEMVLHRDPAAAVETVDIETVFPGSGTVRLTATGVTSASSASARRLGLDVSSDLGPDAIRIDDGFGTSVAASSIVDPRIQEQGTVHFGWSLMTQYQSITVGGVCRTNTARHSAEVYADYGAFGISLGWAFPNGPVTDCTSRFYLQVGGGHWDDFHWRIYNAPVNLAAGKATSQSSTFGVGNAGRAVDSNTDGNWYNNSVTHTNSEPGAWWLVDLGVAKPIGGVVVFNRTDSASERLSDFDILVSPDGMNWGAVAGTTGPAMPRNEYAMNTSGRFVAVQLRGTNYLSLAEVQVFAP